MREVCKKSENPKCNGMEQTTKYKNVPGWLEVRENITLEDPNSQVRFKLKHQAT